jgi:ATP-dependent Clp protease adaptor protein ClpS
VTEAEQAPHGGQATRDATDAWQTVVWNDPVNLMSYVTRVFMEYFHFARPRAESLMRQVHERGSAVVAEGGREKMEIDVQAMHRYGLNATLRRVDA